MFDFYGRSGRLAYLGFTLLAWVVLIGGIVIFAAVSGDGDIEGDLESMTGPQMTVTCLLLVAFVWISLAAAIRRCHDLGWSGWWVLLAMVPLASFIQGLWLLCAPGDEGENEYGAPA